MIRHIVIYVTICIWLMNGIDVQGLSVPSNIPKAETVDLFFEAYSKIRTNKLQPGPFTELLTGLFFRGRKENLQKLNSLKLEEFLKDIHQYAQRDDMQSKRDLIHHQFFQLAYHQIELDKALRELLTNGIDAQRRNNKWVRPSISVKTGDDGSIEVTDTGEGMDIEDLFLFFLTFKRSKNMRLIDKNQAEDGITGMFGTGVFSNFILAQDDGDTITVRTRRKGSKGYVLTIFKHKDTYDYMLKEAQENLPLGTSIRVQSNMLKNPDMMERILRKSVYEPFRYNSGVDIQVNGKAIPSPHTLNFNTLDVLNGKGKIMWLGNNANTGRLIVTVNGNTIIGFDIEGPNIPDELVIDFPENIKLTQDRSDISYDDEKNRSFLGAGIDAIFNDLDNQDMDMRLTLLNGCYPLIKYMKYLPYAKNKCMDMDLLPAVKALNGMPNVKTKDMAHPDYLYDIKLPGQKIYTGYRTHYYECAWLREPSAAFVLNGDCYILMQPEFFPLKQADILQHNQAILKIRHDMLAKSNPAFLLTDTDNLYQQKAPQMHGLFVNDNVLKANIHYNNDQISKIDMTALVKAIPEKETQEVFQEAMNQLISNRNEKIEYAPMQRWVETINGYYPLYTMWKMSFGHQKAKEYVSALISIEQRPISIDTLMPFFMMVKNNANVVWGFIYYINNFAQINFLGGLKQKEKHWLFDLSAFLGQQHTNIAQGYFSEFISFMSMLPQTESFSKEEVINIHKTILFCKNMHETMRDLAKRNNLPEQSLQMGQLFKEKLRAYVLNVKQKDKLKDSALGTPSMLDIMRQLVAKYNPNRTNELLPLFETYFDDCIYNVIKKYKTKFEIFQDFSYFMTPEEKGFLALCLFENVFIPQQAPILKIPKNVEWKNLEDFPKRDTLFPDVDIFRKNIAMAIHQNLDKNAFLPECLKNSKEANAGKVYVRYGADKQGHQVVEIEDTGDGIHDIRAFLFPGISSKGGPGHIMNYGWGWISAFLQFDGAYVVSCSRDNDGNEIIWDIHLKKTSDETGFYYALEQRKRQWDDPKKGTRTRFYRKKKNTTEHILDLFSVLSSKANAVDPKDMQIYFQNDDYFINKTGGFHQTPLLYQHMNGTIGYEDLMFGIYLNGILASSEKDKDSLMACLPSHIKTLYTNPKMIYRVAIHLPKDTGQNLGRTKIAVDSFEITKRIYLLSVVKAIVRAFDAGTLSYDDLPWLPYDYFYDFRISRTHKFKSAPKMADKTLLDAIITALQTGNDAPLQHYSTETIMHALNHPESLAYVFLNATSLAQKRERLRTFLFSCNYMEPDGQYKPQKKSRIRLEQEFNVFNREPVTEDKVFPLFLDKIHHEIEVAERMKQRNDDGNLGAQEEIHLEAHEVPDGVILKTILTRLMETFLTDKMNLDFTPEIAFYKAFQNSNAHTSGRIIRINILGPLYSKFVSAWKSQDIDMLLAWMRADVFETLTHELVHIKEGVSHAESTHDATFFETQAKILKQCFFHELDYDTYVDIIESLMSKNDRNGHDALLPLELKTEHQNTQIHHGYQKIPQQEMQQALTSAHKSHAWLEALGIYLPVILWGVMVVMTGIFTYTLYSALTVFLLIFIETAALITYILFFVVTSKYSQEVHAGYRVAMAITGWVFVALAIGMLNQPFILLFPVWAQLIVAGTIWIIQILLLYISYKRGEKYHHLYDCVYTLINEEGTHYTIHIQDIWNRSVNHGGIQVSGQFYLSDLIIKKILRQGLTAWPQWKTNMDISLDDETVRIDKAIFENIVDTLISA